LINNHYFLPNKLLGKKLTFLLQEKSKIFIL
jgi:hypothetical protein